MSSIFSLCQYTFYNYWGSNIHKIKCTDLRCTSHCIFMFVDTHVTIIHINIWNSSRFPHASSQIDPKNIVSLLFYIFELDINEIKQHLSLLSLIYFPPYVNEINLCIYLNYFCEVYDCVWIYHKLFVILTVCDQWSVCQLLTILYI